MTHEERFDRIEEDLRQAAAIQHRSAQRFEEERDALWEALGLLTRNVNALTDRLDQRIAALSERIVAISEQTRANADQLSLIGAGLQSLQAAIERYIEARGGNGHVSTD